MTEDEENRRYWHCARARAWLYAMHPIVFETVRQAKRAIIAVVGFTVIALGVVMIVTPGPGWLFIFLGLSVLAAEFVWARRLLKRLKEKGTQVREAIFGASTAPSQPAPKQPADEPRIAP